MKERPILFNGAMVRALLDGSKTQTRRIVKPRKDRDMGCNLAPCELAGEVNNGSYRNSPYGQPGDHLWVKETWRPWTALDPWDLNITYAADGEDRIIRDGEFGERDWAMPKAAARGNVSPLFMPRWASRITLEVTGVRVERLQAISESDCRAEGCAGGHGSIPGYSYSATPSEHFRHIWESTGGDWSANPWVWVVAFQRVES